MCSKYSTFLVKCRLDE